ncbi:hypothetical protein JKF63_01648 [Porcisia hertigi]|uniref:Uncharacterized protein n=1 Tax=Porcisia hertigi TaxID=2761500 RepID=A0A836HIH0_9TRYP|nr:hypothetical protein JKF63_01648 [Porcisia hertigi]
MGSCCCLSETANGAPAAQEWVPGKTETLAGLPKPPHPAPSKPFVDPTSVNASRPAGPGGTTVSPPLMDTMGGILNVPVPTAGPPAALADREISPSPSLQPLPTPCWGEEEALESFDTDPFSEPEPGSAKNITTTSAEDHMIAPPQQRSENEEVKQQLACAFETHPSPVTVTPERAKVQTSSPRAGEEDPTRGPSTAQVDEVPPTPKGEGGPMLPADDIRVLQRAPPPPPLPGSTVSMNRKGVSSDDDVFNIREVSQEHQEAAPGNTPHELLVAGASGSEEELEQEQEPNPLTEILRSQQQNRQWQPTASALDIAESLPLEISMGEDELPSTEETPEGEPKQTLPPPGFVSGVDEEACDGRNATQETPMATTGISETVDGFTSGTVYKILRHRDWLTFKETGELRGTPSDIIAGYIKLATAEQAPKVAADLYSDETLLTLLACPIEALSRVAPSSMKEEDLPEGPPLRWGTSRGAGLSPRLYRPLRLKTDVLWRKECANAAEVADKIRDVVVYADFVFDADEVEAPAAAGGLGCDAEKPNVFTTTGEGGAVGENTNTAEDTPSMEENCVYTIGNTDVEGERDAVVMSPLPSDALVEPIETSGEPIARPEHRTSAEVQSAEHFVSALTEAPRRLPPPLPSPVE